MSAQKKSAGGIFALALGSVGTVYGDIGTSPLYAFRESISAAAQGGAVQAQMVIGVLSLIIWALFLIVTLKYVMILLRADNNGEGGILSLMSLLQGSMKKKKKKRAAIIVYLGIIGASLFYGDAVITPAISVLSAVEGLKLVTNQLDHMIIPISILIIIVLFWVQKNGTSKISAFFGPIMVVWFITLAAGGILHIKDHPFVFRAFNPLHAVEFLTHNGAAGLYALGAVFLAVTGAEALYADLGHFGKKPIRRAWIFFVMPALLLNYMGQGALVLKNPAAAADSFYLLYPAWATIPMIILATLATVIASQAVITGAYSLTNQAVQLSLLPRMKVLYTSRDQMGQIYMPQVNWLLLIGIIFIIVLFRSSSSLASAYGIAVTGTMITTAILTFFVMKYKWKWGTLGAALVMAPLLVIDTVFMSANLLKFLEGGYIPVFISAVLVFMMTTWVTGSKHLIAQAKEKSTIKSLIDIIKEVRPQKVSGTAVYFSSSAKIAPAALVHNLRHNKVLHEHNYLLTIHFDNRPYISESERVRFKKVGEDFTRVHINYGYMETTDVSRAFKILKKKGFKIDLDETSFFISRRHIVHSTSRNIASTLQDHVFIMMASNATDAAEYFKIPKDRVVELGIQVQI